jgi:hypothetical protein
MLDTPDTSETRRQAIEAVSSVIENWPLAAAVCRSIRSGIACPFVHLDGGSTVEDVFQSSLKAASRDIESHPRGKLFRRLIEFGPHDPDEPEAATSDGKTVLSDPECCECVEFIFSHMVNRFKGELAELLAIEPCVQLVQRLLAAGHLPSDIQLYWGGVTQERFFRKKRREWSHFVKGADGLLAEHTEPNSLAVHGVVEVKSMVLPDSRLIKQIENHISRLRGGVKLEGREWSGDKVDRSVGVRIMVRPSTWTLSREWHWEETESGRAMVFPEKADPPMPTQIAEVSPGLWAITLDWSEEALEEAAYNMTFGYMGDVGQSVYSQTPLPNSWQKMTAEEGGRNSVKMMLYYMMLRPLPNRHDRLATRLYNVYGFGYPLGVDSREMLWPQDFDDGDAAS